MMRNRDPEAWAKHLAQSSCRIAHETPTGHSRVTSAGVPAGQRLRVGRKVDKLAGLPLLIWQLQMAGAPAPEREFMFHAERKWAADLAWPDRRLLVEFEGGIYSNGRHVRGVGYENDCHKYNAACLSGFRLLRFTAGMVDDGLALDQVLQALA